MQTKAPHLLKGQEVEDTALHFLKRNGLTLLERNFSCRQGEIDLIMRHDNCLVFAEVRYRGNQTFGGAAASVDVHKQRKLKTAATLYLQKRHNLVFDECRFDVVAIEGPKEQLNIEWISHAFY